MSPRSNAGGWQGRQALRLTRSLRGQGALIGRRTEVLVAYSIDIFSEGPRCTANGWIDGACAAFARVKAARLRLSNGFEIEINLEVQDANTATVEVSDPLALEAA